MTGDGQVMQIDQCLSCTRYEPYLGNTYDILNEVGANLAAIQDINAMSHINMQEYVNLTKVNKKATRLDSRGFDPTRSKIREATDLPFEYNKDDSANNTSVAGASGDSPTTTEDGTNTKNDTEKSDKQSTSTEAPTTATPNESSKDNTKTDSKEDTKTDTKSDTSKDNKNNTEDGGK